VPERYCSRCGQDRGRTPHVPLREFLAEAVGEALSLDSRLVRTIPPFFLRPGLLTEEFLAGRRTRYSSPLRLYLVATVAFFLAASGSQSGKVEIATDRGVLFEVGVVEGGTGPGEAGAGGAGGTAAAAERQAQRSRALAEEVGRLSQGSALERLAGRRLEALGRLPAAEANRLIRQAMTEQGPRVLFVLVPVMAGLLALLHRGSGRFFAEHLVFALHVHALGFALLVPGALWPGWLTGAGVVATALYVLLALRRVYRRSWPATVVRYAGLAGLYLVAFAAGMVALSLLALALATA
jgi:hypothetical protein